MPGYTYFWNRDVNAAINIKYIYLDLLDFGCEPWEFRKDVQLMKDPDYQNTRRLARNSKKLNGSSAANLGLP